MFDTFFLVTLSYAGIGFSVAYLVDGLLAYPQIWVWQEKVQIRVMAPLQLAWAKKMCRNIPAMAGDARFPEQSLHRTRRKLIKLTRQAIVAEAEGRHVIGYLLLLRAYNLAAKSGTQTLVARQVGWIGVFLVRYRGIAENRSHIETAAKLSAASFICGRTALDLSMLHDAAPDFVADIDWRIRLAEICEDHSLVYRLHEDALALEKKQCSLGAVKRRLRLMSNSAKTLGRTALAEQHHAASVPFTPQFYAIKREAEDIEYEADEAFRYGQFSRSLRLMREAELRIREYLAIAEEEDPETSAQFREVYRAFKSKMARYAPSTKPALPARETRYLAAAE